MAAFLIFIMSCLSIAAGLKIQFVRSLWPNFLSATEQGNSMYDVAYGEPKRVRVGSVPVLSLEGDSIEETAGQRAVVNAHFALAGANVVCAFVQSALASSPLDAACFGVAVAASVVVGDFATGVFHWATDNYGSIDTPIVGRVCAAFQGHHDTPWTITYRSFANNVHKICYNTIPVLTASLLSLAMGAPPFLSIFFAFFTSWWVVSQEFHKWSHMRQVPRVVKFLQDAGIILSRKEHGRHHSSPFEGHYCILTGMCNPVLDRSGFWRMLEKVTYRLTGNRPNTWKLEPSLSGGVDARTSM